MLRTVLAAIFFVSTGARAEPESKAKWYLASVSTDGARVLVKQSGGVDDDGLHYRVIALDTGKQESEVVFPALAKLPRLTFDRDAPKPVDAPADSAELAADLRAAGTLFASFPLAASERVSARGATATFGVGDFVYAARDGKVGKRLGTALSAWLLADGAIVLRTWTDLQLVDAGSTKLIANTGGASPQFVLTASGAARFLTGDKTTHQICVTELATAKPHTATKRACLPANEHELLVGGQLSTHGTWAAITTQVSGNTTSLRWRMRIIDVEHDKVIFDEPYTLTPTAVSDDGLVVVSNRTETVVIDPHTKVVDQLATPFDAFTAQFRSPAELVVVTRDGAVSVAKTAAWKHTPWKEPARP
jgi:hypothetical protein